MPRPALILGLLFALVFSLATSVQPEARTWRTRSTEGGLMGMLLGDGRRMFANHFTAKADQYFHSGYYPSIFDQPADSAGTNQPAHVHDENCKHDADEPPGHVHDENCHHDDEPDGHHGDTREKSVEACHDKAGDWNVAHDWIASIGSNFRVSEHTHLEGEKRRELLPWLRISAELDPHQINTYLTASYWLRKTDKSIEAEKFIREGLEANPNDCELLFELGKIYLEDRKNIERATRLFELSLDRWAVQEKPREKPNVILLSNIATHLAEVEEQRGLLEAAIKHLEIAREVSPQSAALEKQIADLKARLKGPTPAH